MLPLSVVVVVVDICLLLSMYFNKKYEKKTEKNENWKLKWNDDKKIQYIGK